jgi:hypothetical protein
MCITQTGNWVRDSWCCHPSYHCSYLIGTAQPRLFLPYFLSCTAQQPELKCYTGNYVTCSESVWCYLKYWFLCFAFIHWRRFLDSLHCEFLSSYQSASAFPQNLQNKLWRVMEITSSTVQFLWDIKKGTRWNEIQAQNIRQVIKV